MTHYINTFANALTLLFVSIKVILSKLKTNLLFHLLKTHRLLTESGSELNGLSDSNLNIIKLFTGKHFQKHPLHKKHYFLLILQASVRKQNARWNCL